VAILGINLGLTWMAVCGVPVPRPDHLERIADAAIEMRDLVAAGSVAGGSCSPEHGRSPDPAVRRWQEWVTPMWRRVAGGCHLDRDPLAILAAAGFRVRELDTGYLSGWKPAAWHFLGVAVPA
jgi:hypothetical protein